MDENNNRICSKNTLYRLEEGNLVKDEMVYYHLAKKLGKEVIFNRYDIYEKLEMYRELLADNIVDFSKTNLEKLEARLIIDTDKYQDVLYINEILLLYKNLVQDRLHLNENPPINEIDVILYLKDKVSQTYKKIIIYYFYVGLLTHENYGIDIQKVIEEGKLYKDDPLFYEIKLDILYEMDMLSAYNYLVTTELPKINMLTSYQKFWLYRFFSFVQVNSESFHEAYASMLKAYEIVKTSDFGKFETWDCYLRLGFNAYCMNNHELAIEWLMKVFNERKYLGKDLVIICSSLQKLKKIDLISQIISNTNFAITKSSYAKKVYTYYKLKYLKEKNSKKDITKLENYICDLKPYFETYGQIHKNVFNEDLKEYVKITGNYKKYFLFNT